MKCYATTKLDPSPTTLTAAIPPCTATLPTPFRGELLFVHITNTYFKTQRKAVWLRNHHICKKKVLRKAAYPAAVWVPCSSVPLQPASLSGCKHVSAVSYTVKKVSGFPVTSRDITNQTANLFYSVYSSVPTSSPLLSFSSPSYNKFRNIFLQICLRKKTECYESKKNTII